MVSNGEEDFLVSKHRNGSSYGYRYNLENGTSFTLVHTMKQEIAQEAMGQSQVFTNTISMRYLFRVLEKDSDGNYLIEEQIGALKFKMDNDFLDLLHIHVQMLA